MKKSTRENIICKNCAKCTSCEKSRRSYCHAVDYVISDKLRGNNCFTPIKESCYVPEGKSDLFISLLLLSRYMINFSTIHQKLLSEFKTIIINYKGKGSRTTLYSVDFVSIDDYQMSSKYITIHVPNIGINRFSLYSSRIYHVLVGVDSIRLIAGLAAFNK